MKSGNYKYVPKTKEELLGLHFKASAHTYIILDCKSSDDIYVRDISNADNGKIKLSVRILNSSLKSTEWKIVSIKNKGRFSIY